MAAIDILKALYTNVHLDIYTRVWYTLSILSLETLHSGSAHLSRQ